MTNNLQHSLAPWLLGLIAMLCLCSVGMGAPASGCGGRNGARIEYVVTLSKPTLEKTIGQDLAKPSKQSFVQIVVTKVVNPNLTPISFVVYFHSRDGKKHYLGNFSLFPPDNPGTFIVATHGLLEAGGHVSVTLVPLQRVSTTQEIYARIGAIHFIK